jgi:hypothetical protein
MPVIYCSLTTVFLYALLRIVFEKSIATSFGCAVSFAFCTFVWTYSRNLFDGVLCMCLLSGAMLSMMQFRKTMKIHLFLFATALFGLGVITRLSMVLPLVAFALYLTMGFWGDRKLLMRLSLIGIAVLAPFAGWQTYYNHLRTGHWLLSPVQTGQYATNNALTGNLAVGVFGLLLSPGKSIFLYVPLALLSVVGFRRFRVRYPLEAFFVAVLSSLWLILHARLASWYGAGGWGPRHFVTIAPVLVLPMCESWEWMRKSLWRRSLLICALVWGAILSASSIIGNWQFRWGLAETQGREQAMIWSVSGGQPFDMIAGAISNIRNMALHLPGPYLSGCSPINRHASNTINVWINSAAYAGTPRMLLAAAALGLMAVAVSCMIALRRVILRNSEASEL